MIQFIKGNIFESKAQALVNAVNTVGVMGGGIALEFKNRFPKNYQQYKKQCEERTFRTGNLICVNENDKVIINFPTKEHWKNPSEYTYIETGLSVLKKYISENKIASIAIPALGCGLGGLQWKKVKPMIEESLKEITSTEIYVFEPMN